MAARKNLSHVQKTRDKIKTSMLINRLTDHALGDEDIMTASQVNAAKVLIAKTLPDMKSMEHHVPNGMVTFIDTVKGIKKCTKKAKK